MQPVIDSVVVNDYNEIQINFSEYVALGGTVEAAMKYGAKTALATSAIAYVDADSIKVTTADQTASTLYGLTVKGFADLAGNAMADDAAKTFVGVAKNASANSVASITVVDSKTIEVNYNVKIDATTSVDKANYSVKMKYTPNTAIEVASVAAKDADTVTVTLATDTTASTLYEVTIKTGVKTLYGVATTADLKPTFVGVAKDTTALGTPSITVENNTTINLDFGTAPADSVDTATTKDAFSIKLKYSPYTELAISSISIDGAVVTIKTAAQATSLYELTIKTGIKDIKGNATTADLKPTFVGKAIAAKISDITSATLDSAGTTLAVVFNEAVGATCTDVAHYSISDGIGYPTKAVKDDTDLTGKTVLLTVPKTIDAKLYTLTVKGLENSDGVAMDAAGITETFIGKGVNPTLAKIEAVVATDVQTLKIYFDRPVSDSAIKGKVVNAGLTDVIDSTTFYFTQKKTAGVKTAITTAGSEAYVDPSNANCLVIRFAGASFASGAGFNSFDLTVENAKASYIDSTTRTIEFASNGTAAVGPTITAVAGKDKLTVDLYFDMKVTGVDLTANEGANKETTDFQMIKTSNSAIQDIKSIVKVSDTQYRITMDVALENTSYTLQVKQGTAIKDASGQIAFVDTLDTDGTWRVKVEFAGSGADLTKISDVAVMMVDSRTIEVYFPESMKAANDGAASDILTETNYKVVRTSDVTLAAQTTSVPAFVRYDAATNKATLYFAGALGNDSSYKLGIAATIANELQTNTINNALTTINTLTNGIAPEFAISTTVPAAPKVASVTISDDKKSMDITMDRPIAVDNDGAGITDTGAAAMATAKFADSLTTGAWAAMADTVVVDLFTIHATLTVAGELDLTTTEIANAGNSLSADGMTFTVALAAGDTFKLGTGGYVTTEVTPGGDEIYSMTLTAAKETAADAVKVNFAVPNTVTYDTTAPTLVAQEYYDLDENGKIDSIGLMFDENIDASTVAVADFTTNYAGILGAGAAVNSVGVVDNVVVLLLTEGATVTTNAAVVVDYALGAFKDLAGNNIGAAVTVACTDYAAPVAIVGAGTRTLSATSAQITFSENIVITTPAAGRFAGAVGNVVDSAAPAPVAAVVTLTFPALTFATTVASVVDYSPLAVGNAANLKDAAGKEVVGFTDLVLATGF